MKMDNGKLFLYHGLIAIIGEQQWFVSRLVTLQEESRTQLDQDLQDLVH